MQENSVSSRSRAARPPLPDPPGGREGVLVQGHVVAVSKDRPSCSSVAVRRRGGELGGAGLKEAGRQSTGEAASPAGGGAGPQLRMESGEGCEVWGPVSAV